MNSLFVLAGLYTFLYSPALVVTNTGLSRPLVLVGAMVALARVGKDCIANVRIPVKVVLVFSSLVCALAFAQGLALLRGGDTFLRGLLISAATGVLPLTYLMVAAVPDSQRSFPLFARLTAWLGVVQSLLIVADWWSPVIRGMFSLIVMQPDSLDAGFRAAGLTSMTGDGLSLSQAICGICAIYMALDAKNWRVAFGWALGLSMILATMIFVGRTGLALLAGFGAIAFLFDKRRGRAIGGLVLVALLFLGGVALIYASISDPRLAGLFEAAMQSAFEALLSVSNGNGIQTASTEDLRTMIVVPNSLSDWLIGYGFYANPADPDGNFMGTDIGYLRILLYCGLLGSAAIYAWYILAGIWSWRALSSGRDRMLCAGLMICFFVSQLKFSFMLLAAPLGFTSLLVLSATRDEARCV